MGRDDPGRDDPRMAAETTNVDGRDDQHGKAETTSGAGPDVGAHG